jgi:predicted metal-binding membrane protein
LSDPFSNNAERVTRQGATSLLRRARLSLLVSLTLLTVGAWGLTLYQTLTMTAPMGIAVHGGLTRDHMSGMAMAGMPAAGWSLTGAAVFSAVWVVMMAAMMLPAAAPMILTFAQAQAQRDRAVVIPTWIFIAGYLVVWLVIGILVYTLVQIGSDMVAHLTTVDRASWAPLALGSTLTLAGLYQFTPLKRMCLSHCRSPLAFVALYWREGRGGALQMGVQHGLFCLGCCWALFGVLVAAGVMSLAWMLLLTLLVFAEKVLPLGQRISAIIGITLIALGLAVTSGALTMPWIAS